MSALANPLHESPKKPAVRAVRPSKLNQYGRDSKSRSEQMRGSSDYDKQTGYAPFYHAFWADIPRLTSGNSCTILLGVLWDMSAGRGMKKGQARPEWTVCLRVEDLAQICRCDVRTVERELAALDKRGLAEIRRPGKGEVEARLKYRDWEALPDYKSAVLEMPPSDEAADQLTDEDEAKPGNQRVTGKRPVRLPAGALSKAFPVSCGVKTFRHKAEGPVDLEFSCVIQAGELLVISKFPDDWRQKVEKSIGRSNGINENTQFPRHGCREEQAKVARTQAPVTHPRAGELIALFDPLLAASAARLLSGDSRSLQAACEAIGDCDHNFLVKVAMTRAASRIKTPLHIQDICRDALASWKASLLPGAKLGIESHSPLSPKGKRVAENLRRIYGNRIR